MGGTAAGALVVKMIIAAFSGMGAATICHPLDVVRVQMQTEGGSYKGPLDCASQIKEREGVVNGLYAGISAAYLRQWLYGKNHKLLLMILILESNDCPIMMFHHYVCFKKTPLCNSYSKYHILSFCPKLMT
jgi:hypothetical protein